MKKPDLLSRSILRLAIWGLPIAAMALTGYATVSPLIRTVVWTAALLVIGIGCVLNADAEALFHFPKVIGEDEKVLEIHVTAAVQVIPRIPVLVFPGRSKTIGEKKKVGKVHHAVIVEIC